MAAISRAYGMKAARVRVKICGLTNQADADAAIALGADALGFNLFAGSRRGLNLEHAAAWMRALPPLVTKVAVLVNAPLAEARWVAEHSAIDLVQLHGDEDEAYCAALAENGRAFIKALRLHDLAVIEGAHRFSTPYILLDADGGGAYGGTGRLVNFELAAEFHRRQPQLTLILAGGLRAENVAEAIRGTSPFAVDVASGVECANDPRRKDEARMAAFFQAVRSA